MKKITLLFITILIFSCSNENEKPNLLFILVDDLGWTDVSYNKSDYYETIHIDNLSETSMLFDNAYAASSRDSLSVPDTSIIMEGEKAYVYKISNEIFSFNKEEFPLRGKFKIFNEELVRENLYNSSTKTDCSQSLDELLKIID